MLCCLLLLRDPARLLQSAWECVGEGGQERVFLFFASEMYFHPKQFFIVFIQRHTGLTRWLRKPFTPFPGYC